MIGGAHQVLDVGGERGVGELALRRAEPGEIEAQDRDAERGQLGGNVAGGDDVLRAREAVREQRIGAHRARRQIEPRGELVAEAAGEGDADCAGCHEHLLGVGRALSCSVGWVERSETHRL